MIFQIVGMMIQSDFHIFQGGWNHQPVMVLATIYDPKQLKKLVRMVSNIGHDTWWSMFRRVYSQKMEICVM